MRTPLQRVVGGIVVLTVFGFACGSNGQERANPKAQEPLPTKADVDPENVALPRPVSNLPQPSDKNNFLITVDKWSVMVSGGQWFKSQPKNVKIQHRDAFKERVVASYKDVTPLRAVGRTIGRSFYFPTVNALGSMIDARHKIEGNQDPVVMTLRIKKGVPFWLVSNFANLVLWDARVSHIEAIKNDEQVLIVRADNPAAENPCAQPRLLFRGSRTALNWGLASRQGFSDHITPQPQWAKLGSKCGPWEPPTEELSFEPPAADVSTCPVWRVDTVDETTTWRDVIYPLAKILPPKNAILLNNLPQPDACEPRK